MSPGRSSSGRHDLNHSHRLRHPHRHRHQQGHAHQHCSTLHHHQYHHHHHYRRQQDPRLCASSATHAACTGGNFACPQPSQRLPIAGHAAQWLDAASSLPLPSSGHRASVCLVTCCHLSVSLLLLLLPLRRCYCCCGWPSMHSLSLMKSHRAWQTIVVSGLVYHSGRSMLTSADASRTWSQRRGKQKETRYP